MTTTTQLIRDDVVLGSDVRVMDFVNLYGCSIGDGTLIGPFVEVQDDVRIGRRCKIESHTFICSGTVIEDDVFVGHGVMFTNDRYPAATTSAGQPKRDGDWKLEPVVVEAGAAIGAGAVILPGVRVGRGSLIGAGAVVAKDVGPNMVVVGNPARPRDRVPQRDDVPLFDAAAEYESIKAHVDVAVSRVLASGRFVGGEEVRRFEDGFSESTGGRPAAAVGCGTDVLRLSLLALGVGPGDEVIVPANTFTATAMAVESIGAHPVLADVDEDLHVVTPATMEPTVTSATKAIIPVHLYGHPAPMRTIMEFASDRELVVIEDAAQAVGASIDGRPAGSMGHAAAFSFYPSKNLGACGDGGAVTGSHDVIERVRILRDLGRHEGEHVEIGMNSRLDALQAAILRVKLPFLPTWGDRRRQLADRYRELIDHLPVACPSVAPWATHAYHLFVIRVANRDPVRRSLRDAGIETGVHYPAPLHLQPAHRGWVRTPVVLPVTEQLAGEIVSLPMFPQMSDEQQSRVASELERALSDA